MKIIVDANIVFSAIVNSNSKIGDLLINSNKHIECKIWSGDKQLMKGLAKKGFDEFVTTEILYNLQMKNK